jgi:hypothetical protein
VGPCVVVTAVFIVVSAARQCCGEPMIDHAKTRTARYILRRFAMGRQVNAAI